MVKGKDIGRGLQKLIKKHYDRDVDVFLANLEGWLAGEEQRAARFSWQARNERLTRIYDQAATLSALADASRNTDEVADKVARLFADDAASRAVVCSTVHKMKGLESADVWVLQDTWSRPGTEEDNLRYVAATRSKNQLRLVSTTYEQTPRHSLAEREEGEEA